MTHAIGKMANEIYETVKNDCSVYLYGSVTLDDFREGWSDIDIIALTGHKMSDDEENTLVYLRQKMMKDNPIYRSFEGVILPPRRPHLRNPVPRRILGHQRSADHRRLHRRSLPHETAHNLREAPYRQ